METVRLLLLLATFAGAARSQSGFLYLFGGVDPDSGNMVSDTLLTGLGDKADERCDEPPGRLPDQIRHGSAYAIVDGKPLACGGASVGFGTGGNRECFRLDPKLGWVDIKMDMKKERFFPAFTLIDDSTLWVAGGDGTTKSELFTFAEGWSDYLDMPAVRSEACLAKISDDEFLFGGGLENGQPTPDFWVFSRRAKRWTKVGGVDTHLPNRATDLGIAGMACMPFKPISGGPQVALFGGRYAYKFTSDGGFNFNPNYKTSVYTPRYKGWRRSRPLYPQSDMRNAVRLPVDEGSFLAVANGDPFIYRFGRMSRFSVGWTRTNNYITKPMNQFAGFFFDTCPTAAGDPAELEF